ncbi:hypothetical protein AC1031_007069 [Aphanomyces cochlioides]|nr:hypothetical protein AC1031_007069 [Aphanomyces cochlioides]
MGFFEHIFRTKPIEVILAEEKKEELVRELGLWDLIAIGIGGTVGSGVFATTGDIISGAAGGGAGPAAFLSWTIAGICCIVSGFAYMEMSSIIPSSGSTYAYVYHVLGELPAFVASWLLTLEYGLSGAGVARSWAAKVEEWAEEGGGDYSFLNETHTNLLGALLVAGCIILLMAGLRVGKVFINVVSATKVGVVLFIIIAGFAATKSSNLSPFIPPRDDSLDLYGIKGVFLGASQAFFGYVGFDEVCCMAAEAKNARKVVPRAVIGVILGTMFLSCFASLALSGMVPSSVYSNLPQPYLHNPEKNLTVFSFPGAFGYVGYSAAQLVVHLGEVGTMPVVVLVAFLVQPRIMYAMAVDGLLPEIFGRVDAKGNLFWCTLLVGIFFTIIALIVPFDAIWNMTSIGTLFSFIMTNASLILIRTRESSPGTAHNLTALLVALACFCGFAFQKGYVNNDNNDTWLVISIVSLVLVIITAIVIKVKCPENSGDPNLYRAPLTPFLPAFAIIVNWQMIAQYANVDLGRAGIWIAAAIISYFMYGFAHSQGRSGWAKMLTYGNLGLNEARPSISSLLTNDKKKSLLSPAPIQ